VGGGVRMDWVRAPQLSWPVRAEGAGGGPPTNSTRVGPAGGTFVAMGEGTPVDLGIDGIEQAEPIGVGGSATVYRAVQPRLNRNVAVKVINASTNPATLRRFGREAQALAALSEHPSIATVYDATAITTGADHTCALLGDNTITCWGSNQFGQLGDGTTPAPRTVLAGTTS
jgi:alpha-tubulin suppressor-like RCC1 family protein